MQQISSKELGKVCIQLKKKQFVNKQFLTNKTNQLLSKQMKPKRNSIAIQDRRLFKSYIHLWISVDYLCKTSMNSAAGGLNTS